MHTDKRLTATMYGVVSDPSSWWGEGVELPETIRHIGILIYKFKIMFSTTKIILCVQIRPWTTETLHGISKIIANAEEIDVYET